MEKSINQLTAEKKLIPGAVIPFGSTFWRVLDVDLSAGKALMISDRIVDRRVYNRRWCSITWEKSDIRAWLNGEYLDSAFSEEERAAILETKIKNPD